MKIILALLFMLLCFSVMAQTHTNRGGSGPEGDKVGTCTRVAASARDLQVKYLKMHDRYKDIKIDSIVVYDEFEKLIIFQNFEQDLQLLSRFRMINCKHCLDEKQLILTSLVNTYERMGHCPEFWNTGELIPLIKNVISYDD